MKTAEFLNVTDAAKRAGVSRLTLRRLIDCGELPLYEKPLDRRFKLIRAADIDALRAPRVAKPSA